nr:MAG TPA: hypothetical protein [Caudoviricetes sp.]
MTLLLSLRDLSRQSNCRSALSFTTGDDFCFFEFFSILNSF